MRKLVFQSQPDFTSDCLVPSSAMAAVVHDDRSSRKPVLLQPGFNNNNNNNNSYNNNNAVSGEEETSPLERESSFEHFQSHLISQQREQLAALLAKQSREEKKVKQRSVVDRLFGEPRGDDVDVREESSGFKVVEAAAAAATAATAVNLDRSTSDGSLSVVAAADLPRSGAGAHAFLRLVDGAATEYSDVSSPETSQPKGSAQDLTWDEMADFGQFEENPSTLPLVGSKRSSSFSHCRLSAVVKGAYEQ